MNVLFHIVSGLGTVALVTDTSQLKEDAPIKDIFRVTVFALTLGVISHGVLDYTPHCYPINTKFDMSFGLLLMLTLIGFSRLRYKWIMLGGLLGCILPDLIDLLPAMLNKYLGLNLPKWNKLFPWHWKEYSGSIYNSDCAISNLNHTLLLLTEGIIIWLKQSDLKKILKLE